MDYQAFVALDDKPTGKSLSANRGPLYFGEPEELLAAIADFTVIDDFMSDQDMDDFVEDFPEKFPSYVPFALLDMGRVLDEDPDHHFDSYDEWFLAVDLDHPTQRVLLWTGESAFEELFGSFAAFWSALVDWQPPS